MCDPANPPTGDIVDAAFAWYRIRRDVLSYDGNHDVRNSTEYRELLNGLSEAESALSLACKNYLE